MHNFKELKVWKAGIDLSKAVFEITKDFPSSERFGLISQMTRAVVSIPSNIAEGCGRKSNKELYQFLSIATGSSFELETHVILAKEFNYITEEKLQQLSIQIIEIQKMLFGLQKSLAT
ncbi:four helix bundle protein [Mucilaginibacter agri]|uniref:Four helix bundle protein n=1 Tax=Mucilaginibacter agri TaxID=2695265 RepID=A0A965ZFV6_9SPHI|nr:four helix bundle protein [Mucilaginibacter agri]NCD69239.1 four helix bundle protein [Mucilaginibacter agri]